VCKVGGPEGAAWARGIVVTCGTQLSPRHCTSITRHSPSTHAAYTSRALRHRLSKSHNISHWHKLGSRGEGRACTKSLSQSKCKADPATSSGSIALGVLVQEDAAVWMQLWSQTCRGRNDSPLHELGNLIARLNQHTFLLWFSYRTGSIVCFFMSLCLHVCCSYVRG
jgi:hypothetical protein